jgi:DNA ligase-1
LLDTPLVDRLKILQETLHPADDTLILTASHTVSDAHTLTLLFDEAISQGLEGLVVKKQENRYEAGARNFTWVKLKRHSAGALNDTIDCVLLGYLYGRASVRHLGQVLCWWGSTIQSRTSSSR